MFDFKSKLGNNRVDLDYLFKLKQFKPFKLIMTHKNARIFFYFDNFKIKVFSKCPSIFVKAGGGGKAPNGIFIVEKPNGNRWFLKGLKCISRDKGFRIWIDCK